MIVSGDNEDRQKQDSYNGPTVRLPERVARRRRSWSPLPDYEASEAQYRHSLALDRKKAWHQTRVWRGVLFSLLAYALLTTVIGVPVIVTKLRDNPKDSSGSYADLMANQFSSSAVITLEDNMICNHWDVHDFVNSSRPYQATLQLQLPAGDISIRSNATLEGTLPSKITGNLTVGYDASLKTNNTHISVTMQTSTRALQESTRVCYTETGPNRGLSIFFPSNMTGIESISMNIYLGFPQANSPPLTISNFNVYLPAFAQAFQDLREIQFETVNIEGTLEPIDVTNIQAPRISIKNMLGDISGIFNASESLILDTIRGAINTSITLVKPSSRLSPTTLILDTGDREINADISLFSFAKPSVTPHFYGKVNTFNAPISVNISQDHSIPSVPIYFSVQDNLASPKVIMDQKFEGTFFAQTKMASVTIRQGDENPKFDPTGANRPRTLQKDQGSSSSITSGWIGWGKESTNGGQSHIEVTSSLSPVELYFGPT